MKKSIVMLLVLTLLTALLTGCVGTTVVIGDCSCPSTDVTPSTEPTPSKPNNENPAAVKTGLAVLTKIADSTNGVAKYDVTFVAVAVNDNGVITDCLIDGITAEVQFDTTGSIISDVAAAVSTKNELGDKYGMVAWGGAKFEWNEQAQSFADYVTGKTVEEVKGIAIQPNTKPSEGTDLAASVTIAVGGFMNGVEQAVANAQHRGAQSGDALSLAVTAKLKDSVSATAEKNGTAQLDADVTVLTQKDGVITSCYIDSLQAKVSFNALGEITTDLSQPMLTKNELGDKYNMVAWGGAKFEWNEQAQFFADYVTGKTAAEVAGIAIAPSTKPADGTDLAASVTISIAGFQALIAKAMQG